MSDIISSSRIGPEMMDDVSPQESPQEASLTAARSEVTRSIAVASKTATLFSPALDAIDNTFDEVENPWISLRLATERSRQLVSHEFVFDAGDARATLEADEERATFLAEVEAISPSSATRPLGKLWELDSRSSLEIQAADLAAGWARRALEKDGLRHLMSFFEYITFNGERLTTESLSAVQGRAAFLLVL